MRSKNNKSPRQGKQFYYNQNRVQENHKSLHKICIQTAKQPKHQSLQNKNQEDENTIEQSRCCVANISNYRSHTEDPNGENKETGVLNTLSEFEVDPTINKSAAVNLQR